MTEDARRWLVTKDGTQHGPFSTDELVAGLRAGRISPDAHAWTDGMAGWVPVREMPEAKGAISARGFDSMSMRQLVLLGSLSVGSGLLLMVSNIVRALAGHGSGGGGIWAALAGGIMAPGALMLWKAFRRSR